jgi:ATP-dependent DNA helicase RecQ
LVAKKGEGMRNSGNNYLETLRLYKQGASIDEMAALRGLSPQTIVSHLAYLYEKGESINIWSYLNKEEAQQVAGALAGMEQPYRLKEVFDKLNQEVDYDKIRFAIAWYNKRLVK